jgi:hypothetical protein
MQMIFTPVEKVVWVYIEMLAGVLKLSSEYEERDSALATLALFGWL